MAFFKWSWQFCNIPKKGGLDESGKSVLVRISLVKSREKGYPYRSKSTLFILVKGPFLGKEFTGKGPFLSQERLQLGKVLSFPRKSYN